MTLDALPVHVTALSILQTDGTEIDELLRRADPLADARNDVQVVSAALWAATLRQVGQAAAGFLHIDLGDVMVTGWVKYRELIDAGRRTRGTADPAFVDLAGRDLVLRQHPRVDVTWRDAIVATVRFEVVVDVRVQAVVAEVRGGSLVSLASGSCVVGVSLETQRVKLGPRTRELDPHVVVDLGDGFPLGD